MRRSSAATCPISRGLRNPRPGRDHPARCRIHCRGPGARAAHRRRHRPLPGAEAHLTQIRVRGDAAGAERIIAGYLNQLTKQDVFNRNDAERYLLLASDLPGLYRSPDASPGQMARARRRRRRRDCPAARRNMPTSTCRTGAPNCSGPWGALLRGQLFGLTGLGDRTTVSVFTHARSERTADNPIGP